MRLKLTFAVAALLGYAGWTLAEAPAASSGTTTVAQSQTAPVAVPNGAPAPNGEYGNGPSQPMAVDGHGDPFHGLYLNAEYILWTIRETPLKTFSASVPVSFGVNSTAAVAAFAPFVFVGTVNVVPAALGELEGEDLNRNGARFTIGCAMGDGIAVELSYFQLEKMNFSAAFAGDGKFTFTVPGGGAAGTVNVINSVTGSATEKIGLWGAELNCRDRALVMGPFSVDGLIGFRYVNLDEIIGTVGGLTLASATSNGAVGFGPPPAGSLGLPNTFPFATVLGTANRVYMGQIGLQGELALGNFFLGGWLKAGVGADDQQAKIFASGTAPGFGTVSRTRMDLLGEWNLNAGWQITSHLRASVGYNFLYLKNVVRPGNAISTSGAAITLSSIDLAGATFVPTRSAERVHDDKFFTHGWTFGLELNF